MFEAVYAQFDSQGKLQEYGILTMKKRIDPVGLEKGVINVKN